MHDWILYAVAWLKYSVLWSRAWGWWSLQCIGCYVEAYAQTYADFLAGVVSPLVNFWFLTRIFQQRRALYRRLDSNP